MPQSIKKGFKALLAEADAVVPAIGVEEARALQEREGTVFVDLRDPREIEREGKMPGAFHCPRGMLEFWIDPESPYYKPIFGEDKTLRFLLRGWLALGACRQDGDRDGASTRFASEGRVRGLEKGRRAHGNGDGKTAGATLRDLAPMPSPWR